MRLLVYVNHFYGTATSFRGKSTTQSPDARRAIVEQTCAALRALDAEVELELCGVGGASLLPITRDFSSLLDPRLLVYASLQEQLARADGYDYLINVEDDILLPAETFEAVRRFDAQAPVEACLLPNRLENDGARTYCVDLEAVPGYYDAELAFEGQLLRVAHNPHSGLSILSKAKALHARERVNLAKRDVIIGGLMASAYANVHSPFRMYRPYSDLAFAHVVHLDRWQSLKPAPALSVSPRSPVSLAAIVVTREHAYRLPAIVEALRAHTDQIVVWNNNPATTLTLEHAHVINAARDYGMQGAQLAACGIAADRVWVQDDSAVSTTLVPVAAEQVRQGLFDAERQLRELRESAGVRLVSRVKALPGVDALWALAKRFKH